MPSPVEQIKSRLSIADVVSSYLKLEKSGNNYRARCPFHNERTPSFYVSPSRGTFHCFGCNKGGDMFTFVEEVEGVTFQEALRSLAQRSGVDLSTIKFDRKEQDLKERLRQLLQVATQYYESELQKSGAALSYLKERGIKEDTQKKFAIGFAPGEWSGVAKYLKTKGFRDEEGEKAGLLIISPRGVFDRFRNRIVFPIKDQSGYTVGFSARILPGVPMREGEGKYINSPQTVLYDKSKILYGFDVAKQAIRENDGVILVEGQMDLVLSSQAGLANVVAVSGTALTNEHLTLLRRFTNNITLVLDGDEAGFRASARAIPLALAAGMYVRVVALPKGKDPADMVRENPSGWLELVKSQIPFIEYGVAQIQASTTDTREQAKQAKTHLYPYIRLMSNSLERDSALKKIAELIDNSADAVRADFIEWHRAHPNQEEKAQEELSSQPQKRNRTQLLIDHAMGLLLWSEKNKAETFNPTEAKEALAQVFGDIKYALGRYQTYENTADSNRERLMFEAESYFHGSNVVNEFALLVSALHEELLREDLDEAMMRLRKAERQGNQNEIREILSICQEITKKINKGG